MSRNILAGHWILIGNLLMIGCVTFALTYILLDLFSPQMTQLQETQGETPSTQKAYEVTTFLKSEGIGNIAIQIQSPKEARYENGAPVMIYIPTFFTGTTHGFESLENASSLGAIQISVLAPGRADASGVRSEGEEDYGGEKTIQALADAITFAGGVSKDINGKTLADLAPVTPDSTNVGLFAFSHPGISALNVLASHGATLPVTWYVGRENPTIDKLSAVEVGHLNDQKQVELNPFYHYPENYTSTDLTLSYASIRWSDADNAPYFDKDGDDQPNPSIDYALGTAVPKMFGKRYYSRALLHALRENGVLTQAEWPSDLATPEEADAIWPARETTGRFDNIASVLPHLKTLLLFAENEHVQPNPDRPSIHQLYDGFHDAGLWIRLNPDTAYLAWSSPLFAPAKDHAANTQPVDWNTSGEWAYPNVQNAPALASRAAVAEMMDRTHANEWTDDLAVVLTDAEAPDITPSTRPTAPSNRPPR